MILNDILNFIGGLMESISWDIVFFAGIGFELLLAIFFIIKSRYAYEMRMVRKLLKLNNWLNRNQTIDQNNLLEFNNLMKRTPKLLRYHWHQYMLYRDHEPSYFMSTYNLVEKPIKTSSYVSNIKNFKGFTIALSFLVLVLGLISLRVSDLNFLNISKVIITPFIMIFLNIILMMVMRTRQNSNLSALFQYMHYFERFMDKAVTTMPEYVDFEVLFTRKEIKKGIPVLNEYLEKRARQEQEELEKARLNAVEHEQFDFSTTGIDGSLVLDRAIKETETYLNIRTRLLTEIDQLEEEIESIKRNYENTQKDYQKKMQVSKENVDRLRKQQEETTNRIENNYIKKQQADEIKKQEQLEKDNDSATIRFNQEMESLTTEISTRRKDLEEKRQYVEEAMKAEYQTFSAKMYKSVFAITEERHEEEKEELLEIKDEIVGDLDEARNELIQKNKEIEELKKVLYNNGIELGDNGGFHSEKLQQEAKKVKRGKKNSADSDETDSNSDTEWKPPIPDMPDEIEDNILEQAKENESLPLPIDQIPNEDREYGEDGGFFDKQGYYRYENGAYFDPEGKYFDENGGWYETDGKTYHEPEEKQEETPEPILIPMEEIPEEAREYGEDGGFFDQQGYYRYDNGAYFTPDGRYFDENGGWYEADGETYHEPESVDEVVEPAEEIPEVPANTVEEQASATETPSEIVNEDNTELKPDLTEIPKPPRQLSEKALGEIARLKEQFALQDDLLANLSAPIVIGESEGHYDDEGNFVYPEGYYDKDGNFHDNNGGWIDMKTKEYHSSTDDLPKKTEKVALENEVTENIFTPEETENLEAVEIPPEKSLVPLDEETQSEEILMVESEPKKKKGRPRKEKKEEQDKPKKSRGRPRKQEIEPKTEDLFLTEEPKAEEEILPKKSRGRPKKTNKQDFAELSKQEKKSRGRPKKVENIVEEIKDDKPAKKAGRPKKIKDENIVKTTKSRGRPKKTDGTGESGEVEIAPVKKSKGRPKKEKEILNNESKKSRGRPKKETVNDTPIKSEKKSVGRPKKAKSEVAVKEKKSRGRPSKKVSLDELEALNEQIENENKKLAEHQEELNEQLTKTLFQLDNGEEDK